MLKLGHLRIIRGTARFWSLLAALALVISTLDLRTVGATGVTDAWEIVSSDQPANLYGVDAIASNHVWAVGEDFSSDPSLPLAMKWDGQGWDKIGTPHPGNGAHRLWAVSGSASNNAWAVGEFTNNSVINVLILHWDGLSWQDQSPLLAGCSGSVLYDVHTLSASEAWAVGSCRNGSNPATTLTLHWTGSAWFRETSPNPGGGTGGNRLYGVTEVPGTSYAWAVGEQSVEQLNDTNTLAMVWNGDTWSTSTSFASGGAIDRLNKVVALSYNDVWAVGNYGGNGKAHALAQHWNGTSWTKFNTPDVGDLSNQLQDVSPISSEYLWGVGLYKDSSIPNSTNRNLALRYNGGAGDSAVGWFNVAIPNMDPPPPIGGVWVNELNGVSVVPGTSLCTGGDTWAVGDYSSDSGNKGLILRYTLSPSSNACN